jgi:hypothetical protein
MFPVFLSTLLLNTFGLYSSLDSSGFTYRVKQYLNFIFRYSNL